MSVTFSNTPVGPVYGPEFGPTRADIPPRIGGLTAEQQSDAELLWKKLRQVPDQVSISKPTRDMVRSWDFYAAGDSTLKNLFPGETLPEQILDFERHYLGQLRKAIADPGISKITLLQHVRAFLEAAADAEHYVPSMLHWNEFVALASRQLDHAGKALARLAR